MMKWNAKKYTCGICEGPVEREVMLDIDDSFFTGHYSPTITLDDGETLEFAIGAFFEDQEAIMCKRCWEQCIMELAHSITDGRGK